MSEIRVRRTKARGHQQKGREDDRKRIETIGQGEVSIGNPRKVRRRLKPFFSIQLTWISILLLSLTLQTLLSGSIWKGSNRYRRGEGWGSSVLLLIAHPDDEVMFFSPTLNHLSRLRIDEDGKVVGDVQVEVICLSRGDSQGLGKEREKELVKSLEVFGIQRRSVSIVHHPDLQDGMDRDWEDERVLEVIEETLNERRRRRRRRRRSKVSEKDLNQRFNEEDEDRFDSILTFDSKGISDHTNHKSCYRASLSILERLISNPTSSDLEDDLASHFKKDLRVYSLETPKLWEKYLSLPLAILRHLTLGIHSRTEGDDRRRMGKVSVLCSPKDYLTSWSSMLKHRTQLEWFRFLYLTFSTTLFVNTLIVYGGGVA